MSTALLVAAVALFIAAVCVVGSQNCFSRGHAALRPFSASVAVAAKAACAVSAAVTAFALRCHVCNGATGNAQRDIRVIGGGNICVLGIDFTGDVSTRSGIFIF